MYSTLFTLNITTEVPLSKAPNSPTAPRAPQDDWLHTAPGVCSRCVCAFSWVKCRARIPSIGHHTWPYEKSLSPTLPNNMQMQKVRIVQFKEKKNQIFMILRKKLELQLVILGKSSEFQDKKGPKLQNINSKFQYKKKI